jgi:predicted aspartyl protease
LAGLVLFAANSCLAQTAAPCSLGKISSLPLEMHPDGLVSIPVTVDDKTMSMAVDTGSYISSITFATAGSLGLKPKLSRFVGGFPNAPVFFYANISSFAIGPSAGENLQFFIIPSRLMPPGVAGLLGPDVMKTFDIDLDFAHGALNVFAPNTCQSAPVYWTQQAYAEVPMTVDKDWKIVVPALLDGRAVTVIIDTGSARSFMSYEAAKSIFGWKDGDATLKLGTIDMNGGPVQIYRHPFSTLTMEGIQVSYPDIDLAQGKTFDNHGRDDVQIVLGMSVLRQLHMYIGYQAQKLYLTSAEAR